MKLAIIGFGQRLNSVVNRLIKIDPEVQIVGLVDQQPEEALRRVPEKDRSTVAYFSSLAAMVEKTRPEALAIGTRCDSHAKLAIEAARSGLPLFLEKPVATKMDDAIALEEAFRSNASPVVVSFPLRASAVCRQTKRLLDSGATGPVQHILATNYVPYGDVYFSQWHRDHSVTQGLFLQKATHDFDYMAYLAGAPITRVAAMNSKGRVYRDDLSKTGTPDPDVLYYPHIGTPKEGMNEDSSNALLEFSNGVQALYTQVFYSKRLSRRGSIISGMRGTVEFDFYTGKIRTTDHREPVNSVTRIEGNESHFGGDDALAENFLAMVKQGAQSISPLTAGLQSVYACLAAKESAETGCFINVRQITR